MQNTDEGKLSTQTSKYKGWWFEPATTVAALKKEENDASDDKKAQKCKENKAPERNSTTCVDGKVSDELEQYQAALRRKFSATYRINKLAAENAKEETKETKEETESTDLEYEFVTDDFDSEDEGDLSDSDSAIDETDADELD